MRGVLVDFGFGSLIDKIEEKFGKRVATGLLAFVVVAIFAACVGLIGTNLIKPAVDLYHATNWPDFKAWMIEHLIPTLLSLGVIFVLSIMLSQVVTEVYRRTIGRMLHQKKVDAWVTRMQAEYEQKIRADFDQIRVQAEVDAKARIAEMRERIFQELHNAMESRDSALAITGEILEILGPWLSSFDEAKPQESVEATKQMLEALKSARFAQPLPTTEPDKSKSD